MGSLGQDPGAVFARSNRNPLNEEKCVDDNNRDETKIRQESISPSHHDCPLHCIAIIYLRSILLENTSVRKVLTCMSVSSILVMPTFALLPEETLAAMLLLAAAPVEVANEGGEYFLSQIAEKKVAFNLGSADVVLIPLAMAADALVDAGTYLAASPIMFVRLGGVPQNIVTYGTCAGFYGPVSLLLANNFNFTGSVNSLRVMTLSYKPHEAKAALRSSVLVSASSTIMTLYFSVCKR